MFKTADDFIQDHNSPGVIGRLDQVVLGPVAQVHKQPRHGHNNLNIKLVDSLYIVESLKEVPELHDPDLRHHKVVDETLALQVDVELVFVQPRGMGVDAEDQIGHQGQLVHRPVQLAGRLGGL